MERSCAFDRKADTLYLCRTNIKKILKFLCNQWAVDRKAEWSIWMVYTKVKMPHQDISSLVEESSYHGLHGRPAIPQKLTGEVIVLPHFTPLRDIFVY